MNRRLCVAFALVFAHTIGGCMTSPPAPSENYYRLQQPRTSSKLPVKLHVQRFTADGLLRERAMVYSDDDGHRVLKQHDYHYWMDAPTRLLHDYWAARLQGASSIPVATPAANNYVLRGRLRRMERLLDGERVDVALGLELTVLDDATGAAILHRRYELVEPASSDRVVDSVKAYETALEIIYRRFLDDFSAQASHVRLIR